MSNFNYKIACLYLIGGFVGFALFFLIGIAYAFAIHLDSDTIVNVLKFSSIFAFHFSGKFLISYWMESENRLMGIYNRTLGGTAGDLLNISFFFTGCICIYVLFDSVGDFSRAYDWVPAFFVTLLIILTFFCFKLLPIMTKKFSISIQFARLYFIVILISQISVFLYYKSNSSGYYWRENIYFLIILPLFLVYMVHIINVWIRNSSN